MVKDISPFVTMNEPSIDMRARSQVSSQTGTPNTPKRTNGQRQSRKVFNCIVDDAALVAGIKRSTRNGIRQWIRNGQIRLFVPLHALETLSREKNGKGRHAEDIRDTLAWLDEATTKYPHLVTLQGGDETFEKWAEVEKFAVPRTLFSESDHGEHELEVVEVPLESTAKLSLEETGDRLEVASSNCSVISGSPSRSSTKSVRSSASPISPPTSPAKISVSPAQAPVALNDSRSRPQSASASVPRPLQPLFNYILWRIHQELDPIAALESFIFLCNDANKLGFAKRFDIKTKRLEQLRDIVGREDRDFQARQPLSERNNIAKETLPDQLSNGLASPTTPPRAPAAMLSRVPSAVIDPNAYSRTSIPQEAILAVPQSPRMSHPISPQVSPRARQTVPVAPRGNSGRGNGRGFNKGSFRGRGGNPNARNGFNGNVVSAELTFDGQIDPDSFARRRGEGPAAGRGARKLWVPT